MVVLKPREQIITVDTGDTHREISLLGGRGRDKWEGTSESPTLLFLSKAFFPSPMSPWQVLNQMPRGMSQRPRLIKGRIA